MVTGAAWQGQVVLVSVLDNLLSSVGVGFIIRRGGFIDLVGVYCLQVRVIALKAQKQAFRRARACASDPIARKISRKYSRRTTTLENLTIEDSVGVLLEVCERALHDLYLAM